jgi:hypothetical protein
MKRFAGIALAIAAGPAMAATPAAAAAVAVTPREAFLAASIAAMIGCALLSFVLGGRVSTRTQVALAMLVVLIGGFSLLGLFGLAARETPFVGGLVLLGLIGMFKLMNQFEIRRRAGPDAAVRTSDPPPAATRRS